MRVGTPNFVGARLREAREARGLTATSLSEMLGVSRQAVSQYENDAVTPHPEVMLQISKTLNLPPQFFWQPLREDEPNTTPVFFRSMSAATKMSRVRSARRSDWLADIVDYLRLYVELPPVNFPVLGLTTEPSRISAEDIERAAGEIRAFWGLGDGPIQNMIRLLEKNGVIVSYGDLGADELDALSVWRRDIPYAYLNSAKMSLVRTRFDAAHELGHMVLHRGIDPKSLSNPVIFKLIEDQAYAFAGAFLLPTTKFPYDVYVPTLDALLALKPKWLCSVAAMLKRLENLQIIPPDHARRLWVSYSARRWKRVEPLDDRLQPERPQLLKACFELIIDQSVQSREQILAALPYAAVDIEELAGLSEGYLSNATLNLRSTSRQGNVIPLPPRDGSRP